ncbi:hypothetical protein GWI33_002202 [Rhynchophorus ferrugineus]|uniref:MADF domain-containing protein n=1 Tax=Rhynchophorus ferrugineus TaxID=354439 RepID=A0A834IPM9_RHYFE|nr:hypothetical protein GWI33_002202 [Rhynchophorus ferrugineus]
MESESSYDTGFSFVSKEHENFIREFLEIYRDNSVLWDKKHPHNKNIVVRYGALENLLGKSREYFPQADIDFVRHKLDGIKNAFRREHRKVVASKRNKNENYVPNLWYYNLMLFTVGEDDKDLQELFDDNKHIWTRDHIVLLIDLFKNHPILYSAKSPNNTLAKRNEAYSQITKKLVTETGKYFEIKEVRKKITSLKDQFRRDYKNKKLASLWCYDLLSFLENEWIGKRENIKGDSSDDENLDVKPKSFFYGKEDNKNIDLDQKDSKIFIEENYDDIFDAIESLINDVMYNGLMEKLNSDSKLLIDGF